MMTRSHYILLSCILLSALLAACSGTVSKVSPERQSAPAASPALAEDKHIASVDVVKATPQAVEIAVGNSGELTVALAIQSGYHVNANPPTYSYLKATELEISPGEGITASHLVYPKAINRKFPFAEKPLAVYEGEVAIKTTLKADKTTKPGQQSMRGKLRIQACDEAVCYPPGTIDLLIPVSIK